MRAQHIEREELAHVLAALMPDNRLAVELSAATGLRIDDCLSVPTAKLAARMTVKEQKTGKSRRVYIPVDLLDRLHRIAGRYFVFEGRSDPKKHRTRQAVFKDLRRAASLFRLPVHVSPHTARKVWAVEQYRASGCDLKHVQRLLHHSSEAVTMLYAMADTLSVRRRGGRNKTAAQPKGNA